MPTTGRCGECGNPLLADGDCPICALKRALALSGQDAEAQVIERAGDGIGRFKLLEKIGEGGYGVVYLAEQAEPIRRRVALKIVKLGMDTRHVIARFEAERQALALMDHPNIAKVLDAGATDTGRPYFVMELVRGAKITDYCDQHNLSTRERLDLFIQVCQAVQHAHQKGIIHRDLKPSNILVTLRDGTPVPKVIDFGIAKATQQPLTDKTLVTGSHQFIGTPGYMSPEQAEMGPQDIDTRSDIYALGVILYELLTGGLPFDQKQLRVVGLDRMRRLIQEKIPPRPSTHLSTLTHGDLARVALSRRTEPPRLIHSIRGDLDWIVMKCLEKDRGRRYESASGLAQDLLRHLSNEPVTAAAPSALYRAGKFIRRHWLALAAATALVLLLAAGVVALAIARGFRMERDAAQQVTALRSAELSARNGQWRRALTYLDQAEAAGYRDQVHLGLQRAEAWTILSEPAKSWAELKRLAARSDLKSEQGAVLLRLGEHELFDLPTADRGVQHVRQATRAGLNRADAAFAEGLLADSTQAALERFRQALQFNPYHHSAHRHSLGLEFLLGRHSELADHIRLFKVLYPEDPTPGFLEAMELAIQGHLAEARSVLAGLRGSQSADARDQFQSVIERTAGIARRLELDTILAAGGYRPTQRLDTILEVPRLFQPGSSAGPALPPARIRLAQLPCIRQGMYAGAEAVSLLAIPYLGNEGLVIQKVEESWRHHPEGSMPVLAALLLESRHSPSGPRSPPVLQMQAALLQMGADSTSLFPDLPRLARYLAARIQYELARGGATNATPLLAACQANLRHAALAADATPAQCQAWYELSLGLRDYDSAHAFLGQWQRLEPGNPRILELRHRVQSLETAEDRREGGLP